MIYRVYVILCLALYISDHYAKGETTQLPYQPVPCTAAVARQCAANTTETWVEELIDGNLSVISSLDIDHVCSTLDQVFQCIGSSYFTCHNVFKLAYYTVVAAGRYICNDGKQGFINNTQCFKDPAVLRGLQTCTTDMIQNFPDTTNSSLKGNKDELCGLYETWGNCMVQPVMTSCSDAALDYMGTFIEKTFKPMRYVLLCNIGQKACLSAPCQNGGACISSYYEFWNYNCDCLPNYTGRNCEHEIGNQSTTEEGPVPTPEGGLERTTEGWSKLTPEGGPEPTSEGEPEPTPEVSSEPSPEGGPQPTIEEIGNDLTTEWGPEPTPEGGPEPTSEGEPEPTPEVISEPSPEGGPEPTTEEISLQSTFEWGPMPTPEGTPESTPQAGPEPTSEAGPEPTPEKGLESTTEGGPETTPEVTSGNDCDSSPCYNGGICSQTVSGMGFSCDCPFNMFGPRCEYGFGGCPGFPCYNGGSCLTDDNGPKCYCSIAFTGDHCEGSPTTVSSNSSTTGPTIVNTCDMEGTFECLKSASGTQESLQWFATGNFGNITEIDTMCQTLEVAYNCIGSKLDNCSAEIRLLRDVVISGARYICNGDKSEFVAMMGCFQQLAVTNTSFVCLSGIKSEFAKYFSGELNVFTNSVQFCSLLRTWTQCYMGSLSSICDQSQYAYMYRYLKSGYQPVEEAIQCDATAALSFPAETTTMMTVGECQSSPCFYGGTCIPRENGFECVCPQDVFGQRCGMGNGGCPGFPCYNGGTCLTEESGAMCLCSPGYHGLHCEITPGPSNGCLSSPCYNGGTCFQSSDGYECNCPENVFGIRCELGVGGCPGFPCYNGASCQTDDNGPRCLCPFGFTGDHCESPATPGLGQECRSSPCYNGGICIQLSDGFECDCLYDSYGQRCQFTNGGCQGFLCYNGGTCETHDNGQTCLCAPLFSGLHCEDFSIITTATPVTTTRQQFSASKKCRYIGWHVSWRSRPTFDQWCTSNCSRGFCSQLFCKCYDDEDEDGNNDNLTPTMLKCKAKGRYRFIPGMERWCTDNCNSKSNFCPKKICQCRRLLTQ